MVASYPLSSLAPTPVEVELGCDNILNKIPPVVTPKHVIDLYFLVIARKPMYVFQAYKEMIKEDIMES